VAEAVATGASDRQVAADLFLSPRTVAFHLSSVYRKLGLSGRASLAARLAQASPGSSSGERDDQAGPG
jgi:DNA-binding CsgD family transcriptional regulator